VSEHNKRGYEGSWLSGTFSAAVFGNGVVAIIAGIIAEWAAGLLQLTSVSGSVMMGGYCSPFDLSMICLAITWALIAASWGENFGGGYQSEGLLSTKALFSAANLVISTPVILYTGVVQSLFEGAMYTFVFMWTPVLTPADAAEKPPYGMIFSTFMVCCMAGSSIFNFLVDSYKIPVEQFTVWVMAVAAAALSCPIWTSDPTTCFYGFLLFEACVGLYFPAIYTMKSKFVPEHSRAAVYNIFRVPLNAIVLAVLLNDLSVSTTFTACTVMLGMGAVAQSLLLSASKDYQPVTGEEEMSEDHLPDSATDDMA
jgi:hypothetical protein